MPNNAAASGAAAFFFFIAMFCFIAAFVGLFMGPLGIIVCPLAGLSGLCCLAMAGVGASNA